MTTPPPPPPPPYEQSPYGPPPGAQPPNNTLGLIGMIVGIISIPLACCGFFGVAAGIAGAVLGYLGRKKVAEGTANNDGQAKAGFICGIIGAALGVLSIILSFTTSALDWSQYTS